jgi:hypothetical protein
VRLFNDPYHRACRQFKAATELATPREFLWTVRRQVPEASDHNLDRVITIFEVANYSLHGIGRDDYVKSYHSQGAGAMSPVEKLLDRRELAADVYVPVAIRTLTLIIVLAILYMIAGPGRLFPDFQQLLAPFFVPVAASAIAWYLGTLVPIIFAGRLIPAVQDAFVAMAIILFIALTFSSFSDFGAYTLPTLLTGGAIVVYLIGAAGSDDARLVARAILLEGIGISIMLFTSTSASADISLLGEIICGGFTLAAVLGLAGLLADHTSKYVSRAGAYLGKLSTIALVCIAFIAVLVYGQFLRSGLAASLGQQPDDRRMAGLADGSGRGRLPAMGLHEKDQRGPAVRRSADADPEDQLRPEKHGDRIVGRERLRGTGGGRK